MMETFTIVTLHRRVGSVRALLITKALVQLGLVAGSKGSSGLGSASRLFICSNGREHEQIYGWALGVPC